ncbi:hypothetical protein BBJ28_00011489 [Nothophytophthora sp. Chile5]|nr:hypothetical protein BBJ28_00011489 [Nothophytophthora sp. Chile5]
MGGRRGNGDRGASGADPTSVRGSGRSLDSPLSPKSGLEDVLDALFTDRSVASNENEDEEPMISSNYDDDQDEASQDDNGAPSNRSEDQSSLCPSAVSTPSTDTARSNTSQVHEGLPPLSRGSSFGEYSDYRLHSAEHSVGRTRIPWHSKSVTDLRDAASKPVRIVAFDVGGKLFRCKESLIAKFPQKRLNQIITCSCGKISCLDDAFFIDRNPQHFEMILDWYRTGKLVRQRDISEEAFKDDAVYFDLYDELFPVIPTATAAAAVAPVPWRGTKLALPLPMPPRRRSVNDADASLLTKVPTAPLSEPQRNGLSAIAAMKKREEQVPELSSAKSDGPLRFFRRERRVLKATSIPLVFTIRKFEQLVVESVKGCGRLMIRVCDSTGMQTVHVPEAVLFDSRSRFYLEGGRAQLQRNAVLPGHHVYTFWMEENADQPNVKPQMLDIEFKLLFMFEDCDRLTAAMETELERAVSESKDAVHLLTPDTTRQAGSKTQAFTPSLFLPPSKLQSQPLAQDSRASDKASDSSVKATLRLSPLSKGFEKTVARGNQQHEHSSPIRQAGAAIVRRGQQPFPRPAEGKITIYQPEKLDLKADNEGPSLRDAQQQGARNRQERATYHELQPRLFR